MKKSKLHKYSAYSIPDFACVSAEAVTRRLVSTVVSRHLKK
jgi:hypothetical protein